MMSIIALASIFLFIPGAVAFVAGRLQSKAWKWILSFVALATIVYSFFIFSKLLESTSHPHLVVVGVMFQVVVGSIAFWAAGDLSRISRAIHISPPT